MDPVALLLIPWCKWHGLGLQHDQLRFILGFKFLPSMKRSSRQKMIITKNKQVRGKGRGERKKVNPQASWKIPHLQLAAMPVLFVHYHTVIHRTVNVTSGGAMNL
jgi:hypothetical protein